MPVLPVFAIVKRAFAFFSLHLAAVLKLFAIASVLTVACVLIGALGYVLTKSWVVVAPCVVFFFFAWTPFMLRIYQLAALGESDPSSYLSSVFTGQSLRYLGYSALVGVLSGLGLTLAFMPVILAFSPATLAGVVGSVAETSSPVQSLASLVSMGLVLAFLILSVPLNLIFPAVSLEREPSLSAAYALGSGCKLRLLLAMAIPGVFFMVLGQIVQLAGDALSPGETATKSLILLPLQLVLTLMGTVTNASVPAQAYRFLRGLPCHGPEGPLPGEVCRFPAPGADQACSPDAATDAAGRASSAPDSPNTPKSRTDGE